MKKKYDYTIYPENNPTKFKDICSLIESSHPELSKDDLLVDVDGSTIQIYGSEPNEVIVYDDYVVGAVYVKSDIDLSEILKANTKAENIGKVEFKFPTNKKQR